MSDGYLMDGDALVMSLLKSRQIDATRLEKLMRQYKLGEKP